MPPFATPLGAVAPRPLFLALALACALAFGSGVAGPPAAHAQTAQASTLLAQAAVHDRLALQEDSEVRRESRRARRWRKLAKRRHGTVAANCEEEAASHRWLAGMHKKKGRWHRRLAAKLRRAAAGIRPAAAATPVRPKGAPRPLGAAISWQQIQTDSSLRQTFLARFDQMTAENDMKMFALQPREGAYNFTTADALVDWARANGKRVRGHTLVFGQQLPGWLSAGNWTRQEALDLMQEHITTVMQHFKGRVAEWDVVNEAIGGDGSMIPNFWYQKIGSDYVEQAFRFARAADPTAKLFYNDGGIDLPDHPHTLGVRNMLADLLSRGTPVDGVGLQNHVTNVWKFTEPELSESMRRFTTLGLDVAVTEMDVKMDGGGTRDSELNAQKQVYADGAAACRYQPRCTSFTTWGVSDRYTWLPGTSPLLYDETMQQKPALGPVVDWIQRP